MNALRKIGDKVKVRTDIEIPTTFRQVSFVHGMMPCRGQTLTIKNVFEWCGNEVYEVKENTWTWTDEMFEGTSTHEVEDFLKSTFDENNPYQVRPRIECKDGYTVSVQGGTEYLYCTPRQHVNEYEQVEVGYPMLVDEELLPYAEDSDRPTDTVYPYVPVYIIEEIIQKHGGIKEKVQEPPVIYDIPYEYEIVLDEIT